MAPINSIVQTVQTLDLTIYQFVARFAGNWLLDRLAFQEEANNLLKGGIFVAMYWYLWFRDDPDREQRRRQIIGVVLGVLLAIIVTRAVAFVVPFRVRPIYNPALAHPSYSISIIPNLENWSSFPSDMAAYFFGLAFGLAYFLRRLAIPILLYAFGWACCFRIYLGLHYASDIVVGIAIGIVTVWVTLKSKFVQSLIARRVSALREIRPAYAYTMAFLISFEMATVFAGCRGIGRAVLHIARAVLHRGFTHSRPSTPIDEWGGVAITALVAAGAICLLSLWRRIRFHGSASSLRDSSVQKR